MKAVPGGAGRQTDRMVTSISFGPQVCGSVTEGSRREWLVPDGCGGYAMGTVTGLRTRRYHGLLVVPVAARPPDDGGWPRSTRC